MYVQDYLDKHMLSRKIEDAVNAAVRAKTPDPVLFIVGSSLLLISSSPHLLISSVLSPRKLGRLGFFFFFFEYGVLCPQSESGSCVTLSREPGVFFIFFILDCLILGLDACSDVLVL